MRINSIRRKKQVGSGFIIFAGLVLFLLLPDQLNAQFGNDSIHFTGCIYDGDSLTNLPFSHYYHCNKAAVSDKEGNFMLWVEKMDTVRFSHIGYKEFFWVIPDSVPGQDLIVGVFLSKDTVMINEVVIFPRLADLKSMAVQPFVPDKEVVNARNNLKIMQHQSKRTSVSTWDAERNQDYQMNKYTANATNLGLISPDEMVPITAAIPLAYALLKQYYERENKEELVLNDSEKDLIKSFYNEQILLRLNERQLEKDSLNLH